MHDFSYEFFFFLSIYKNGHHKQNRSHTARKNHRQRCPAKLHHHKIPSDINAETGKCFSDIFFLVFRLLCNLHVQVCFLLFLNFSVFLHVSLLNQQDTDIFSWPYGLETALPCKEICQISRIFCGKIENMSKWLFLIFLCIFLQACECFFFSLQ